MKVSELLKQRIVSILEDHVDDGDIEEIVVGLIDDYSKVLVEETKEEFTHAI